MSKDFAIVKIGRSQYQVTKGDVLTVEKLEAEEGKTVKFADVLLTFSKDKATIGQPTVKGALVEAKVLDQFKGKKMYINKFKAKSRYRKKIGHRQMYTKIEITKI